VEETKVSLLEEYMENCTMLDKRTVSDGYGGYTTEYADGVSFKAAITLDTSTEARVAEKEGVTALYTVTTTKALNLQYHDVFKRLSDGKIFRVKSDGDDKKTPNSATLNMRQVSAEEWTLNGQRASTT
jgi:hypothetical protein